MKYQIDKDIPVPDDAMGNKGTKYPFKEMEVGDSFFVPAKNTRPQTVIGACTQAKKRLFGHCFQSKQLEENGVFGIRVWRVK